MTSQKQPLPSVKGFDSEKSGRVAECDGGRMIPGTRFAGREEFTGTLTGDYVDHGEPPWRWYLMTGLTRKPENFEGDAVWCESESLFLEDDESEKRPLTGPLKEGTE